jgi:uncharacterized protein (TIGR03435 family)
MRNGLAALLGVAALLAPVLGAQSKPAGDANLTFDVVSVKTNKTGPGRQSIGGSGARWAMVNVSAAGLILNAYPGRTNELIGAPAWVTSERFDVDARATFEPDADQQRIMLRALLADRFKFTAHVETPERPIYHLVVARADGRLGPQIRRIDIDCATYKRPASPRDAPQAAADEAPPCSYRMSASQKVTFISGGRTMQLLADVISPMAGRPVFDKTALAGYYAFKLEFAEQGGDDATLFTALPEQLGLKLEPTRGPVEILAIDHIERPTEN